MCSSRAVQNIEKMKEDRGADRIDRIIVDDDDNVHYDKALLKPFCKVNRNDRRPSFVG